MEGAKKLADLRQLMKTVKVDDVQGIDAYIVTMNDAHQSEYIRDRDKRIKFLSGFSGSAGTVVVTQEKALLWTDGRYFAQAVMEFDPPELWTLMKDGTSKSITIEEWLRTNLSTTAIIGADPNYMSHKTWSTLNDNLSYTGHSLKSIEHNLIDEIWKDKPLDGYNDIVPHPLTFTGKTAGDKVKYCFEELNKNKVDVLVISALDEVAYLLNLRGTDISYNPVFFAYVILHSNEVHIFLHEEKLTNAARQQLIDEKVNFTLHAYESIGEYLKNVKISDSRKTRVWLANDASEALYFKCIDKSVHHAVTPPCLMKLVKNTTEIEGMKQAHIKDGVALIKFYSWLEKELSTDGENKNITEIRAAEKLEEFRKEEKDYQGPSFPTISSYGEHAAIIHYKPSEKTNISITTEKPYLCDAGAQFLEGTTDVTRTLHFGQPSDYEKECFTRVFKGQSGLSMTKFPTGIKGNCLDSFARKHLWDVGLNYLHGTGHGVGSFLNVHEFPVMISWRPYPEDPGVKPGMFLSNEPGYYEDGNFGIRLENVEMIVNVDTKYKSNVEFLTFETVTMVPIQRKMLNMSMLTDNEIQYLDDYHKKCYDTLSPYLQKAEHSTALNWLKKETSPIRK
ncbi:unnamed protein product [Trichogramma brassicae]|uniref:Aminopeptidase P N-terminal domain-containing protein n=1 Tax=Trichogramma brassicae TaxID=86971 RepID=A0A6H5ID88_9HYME|nr:unnamed protein product [Trichogramma brassicae]